MIKEIIGLALIVFCFTLVLWIAFDRQEELECYKWQEEQSRIRNYQTVEWQIEQCLNYEIDLR